MSGRPPTSGRSRMTTGAGRPGSRMGTGAGRPGTRGGQPQGSNIFASVNVADRPMTQQGLGGMKTAGRGQRMVQDRTYWLGEVRTKCNELSSEIRKVETEIGQRQEENNTYIMFEKRAETLASELSELQGQLHDYNLMIDRINTNRDISDIVEDLNALKVQNERESSMLEEIFIAKQKAEKELESLDKQLHRQQMLTENRVQDMNSSMRTKYSELKNQSLQTMDKLTTLQNQLDDVTAKQNYLERELENDPLKMEAVALYEQLNSLTAREEQLLMEEKNKLSPEEEQERLTANVRLDNQEISTMDRQTKDLDERIRMMQEEMLQIDSELEDQQSESTDKFRQLQKREQTMDEFMASYNESRSQETQEQGQLEGTVLALLEQISKTVDLSKNLPTAERLKALKDDLQFKESELVKAESTSSTLIGQSAKLQEDLSKVEELESKMSSEKEAMIADVSRMEEELLKYRNIDELKSDAEKIKVELKEEKEELEQSRRGRKGWLEEVTAKHNELLHILEESETHVQLENLEKKWQHIEQNNFAVQEFISMRAVDSKPVKTRVLKMISENNKLLQDLYTKSSMLH